MSRTLVAYFSAGGRTAKVAARLAEGVGAELYEIRPCEKYSKADLNWMNRRSRSSVEMNDKSFRSPVITVDLELSGILTDKKIRELIERCK